MWGYVLVLSLGKREILTKLDCSLKRNPGGTHRTPVVNAKAGFDPLPTIDGSGTSAVCVCFLFFCFFFVSFFSFPLRSWVSCPRSFIVKECAAGRLLRDHGSTEGV